MKDNAFGNKKSIDFFPANLFCKSKQDITLLMFLSLHWSVQSSFLGHQTEEFMPLGQQVEEFILEFRELFFFFLFASIFPVRKVLSQCPNVFWPLLGGAEWQEQAGTGTRGGLPLWSMWWGLSLINTVSMEVYVLNVGEGYWMISCPRWRWPGLCSQFCHAVLLARISLCIVFLRNSEWERVQLNLRAGHRDGAPSA